MSKRNYNVFFHTHTVSGIVISVALYVIFFCGAFALFKDEIELWEKGEKQQAAIEYSHKIDDIVQNLKAQYPLEGRDIRLRFQKVKPDAYVNIYASKDTLAPEKAKSYEYFWLDLNTYESKPYYKFYSLGEFIYRLHFFSQIPSIGLYLAGFVSLFFLFAIVTGIIVHWKKIIPQFFVFRPKAKLKTIWTDAHTALGTIGLPFQLVFALTGSILCLTILILLPANYVYQNNQDQLIEDLRPMTKTYELQAYKSHSDAYLPYLNEIKQKWPSLEVEQIYIKNYGTENALFQMDGILKNKFVGSARAIVDLHSKKLSFTKDPNTFNYLESVELSLRRLHFADYGGLSLKVLYFIMALITCFVIITGVLIWLEARNKKSKSYRDRQFYFKVTHIYLAICLGLYPITAISFIMAKLLPRSLDPSRQTIIYAFFLLSWFALILFYRFKRDAYYINRHSLKWGSIIGLCIPVVNGLVSGNWLWKTLGNHQHASALVDVLWILLGAIGLWILKKLKKKSIHNSNAYLEEEAQQRGIQFTAKTIIKTTKKMRTKLSLLWLFLAIGFIFHHIYGLASVFFNETVFIEGSTGETPMWAHGYRIAFEGIALLFAIFTLQTEKTWFIKLTFVWSIIIGLFNIYHVITAIIYEATNLSEILILVWMVIVSIVLFKDLKVLVYPKK